MKSKRHLRRAPTLRIPNRLFLCNAFFRPVKAAVTAAAAAAPVEEAAEDGWEDFTNNLGSDLAPIISLFGEQVTKQYLSESVDWLEAFIFSMAPLGIITAVVSAIRIAGNPTLRSIVGRPKESKASVEIELLSTTSSDVCEMWNGQGITRVQGESLLGQFVYVKEDQYDKQTGRLRPRIYNLKQAVEEGLYATSDKKQHNASQLLPAYEQLPANLTMNMSRKDIPRWQIRCIAAIGVILQSGVIVYAALTQYTMELEKEGEKVANYAFPLMSTGTVLLCGGMFLCGLIITRAARVTRWDPQTNGSIVFLQRSGHVVGDQVFGSFCRVLDGSSLLTSKGEFGWNGRDRGKAFLAKVTTVVSMVGFIVQFTGLRGMHASVILAQLSATAVMTGLRSWMRLQRRQINEIPTKTDSSSGLLPPSSSGQLSENLDVEGYEVDWLSMRLENCPEWCLGGAIGEPVLGTDLPLYNTRALKVIDNRYNLMLLTRNWKNDINEIAARLKNASEQLINTIYTNCVINIAWQNETTINLPIPVRWTNMATEEYFYITFKRLRDGEQGKWTTWSCETAYLETILSLHLWSSLRTRQISVAKRLSTQNENRAWFMGPQSSDTAAIFDNWISRGNTLKSYRPSAYQPEIIGVAPEVAKAGGMDYLALSFNGSCAEACARTIFAYICYGLCDGIASVGGQTVRRIDDPQGLLATNSQPVSNSDCCLVNSTLKDLAIAVSSTQFCNVEEVYMSIIPPLSAQGKLPEATEAYGDAMKSAAVLMRKKKPGYEEIFWWVHKNAKQSAPHIASQAASQLGTILLLQTRRQIIGSQLDSWDDSKFSTVLSQFRMLRKDSQLADSSYNFIAELGSVLLYLAVQRKDVASVGTLIDLRCETQYGADKFGRTILQKAIETRSPEIIKLFMDSKTIPVNASAGRVNGRTALQIAAENGDLVSLELLLQAGADVNASPGYKYGFTAIQAAAKEGHIAVLERLKEAGGFINAPPADRSGRTALQAAAEFGRLDVVSWLLGKSADPNFKPAIKHGLTALQAAAKGGHKDVFNMLLGHGADLKAPISYKGGLTPLQAACAGGNLEIVQMLLDLRADVNAPPAMIDGRTALQAAAERGSLEIVKLLLANGASVNASMSKSKGITALEAASANGHSEVVKLLLNAKADVNPFGRGPLNEAAENGHLEIVNLLLESGATVEPSYPQTSALVPAAAKGHLEIVKRLLHGVRDAASIINRKAVSECNALQAACKGGHLETVNFLIANGADVNLSPCFHNGLTAVQAASAGGSLDCLIALRAAKAGWGGGIAQHGGRDPLQAACEAGHEQMVEYLLKHQAPVGKAAAEYGLTALQAACKSGNIKIVSMIMEAGGDLSIDQVSAERGGRTALEIACEGGHLDIVDLLLSAGADPMEQQSDYVTSQKGFTYPLPSAIKNGHLTIVEVLLEMVDWANTTNRQKGAMLLAAAQAGHLPIMERLLEAGVDVDPVGKNRQPSALSEAAANGHSDVVEALIRRKANVNYRVRDDQKLKNTPLERAAAAGHFTVAKVLLQNGADIGTNPVPGQELPRKNVFGDYGFSPVLGPDGKYGNVALRNAVKAEHLGLVKLLRDKGATELEEPQRKELERLLYVRKVLVYTQEMVPVFMDNAVKEFSQIEKMAQKVKVSRFRRIPDYTAPQTEPDESSNLSNDVGSHDDAPPTSSESEEAALLPAKVAALPISQRPDGMSRKQWKKLQWHSKNRLKGSTDDGDIEMEILKALGQDTSEQGAQKIPADQINAIPIDNSKATNKSSSSSHRIVLIEAIGHRLTLYDVFDKSEDPYDQTTFFSANIPNEARSWYEYMHYPSKKKDTKSIDECWHIFPRLLNRSGAVLSCNGKGFYGSGDRSAKCPGTCEHLEICKCGIFQFIRSTAFTDGPNKKQRSFTGALKYLKLRFSEDEWQRFRYEDEDKLRSALTELNTILEEFDNLPAQEESRSQFIYPQLLFSPLEFAKEWRAAAESSAPVRWNHGTIPWPVFPLCQGHGTYGFQSETLTSCYGSPLYEGYDETSPSIQICQCGLFKMLKSGGIGDTFHASLEVFKEFFDPDKDCWQDDNIDAVDGVEAYTVSNKVRMIYSTLEQFTWDWKNYGGSENGD